MPRLMVMALLTFGLLQDPSQSETGSIEGSVVLADRSSGLAGALIVVSGIASRPEPNRIEIQSVSGKDGHFRIQDIPPGTYTLNLQAPGFVRSTVGRIADFGSFTIHSQQEIRDVILNMAPEAKVSGHIVDPNGWPAAGARVELQSTDGSLITAVSADPKGEFLAVVPPGEIVINATYQLRDTSSPNDSAFAKTYFPGVVDSRSALRVNVREGENISGLDFRIQNRSFVQISGTVVPDPSLIATLTGVDVFLQAVDSNRIVPVIPQVSIRPIGGGNPRFEFGNVESGRYTIFAVIKYDSGTSSLGRTSVDVGTQDVNGLVVNAHQGLDVRGRISVAANAAIKDSMILVPALETDEHRLPQKVGAILGFGEVQLNSNGEFVISNVPEGQYNVSIGGLPPDTVVIDAEEGSTPLEGNMITISGHPPAPLHLTIGAGGIVRGTVMDSSRRIKGGVPVVLSSDRDVPLSSKQIRTVVSNAEGSFEFRSVTPGYYSILAFGSGRMPSTSSSEMLERYRSFRVPVYVSSGANIFTTVISAP